MTKRIGFTIYPIGPDGIAGDVVEVHSTSRASWKMLWSIARQLKPDDAELYVKPATQEE